jgi:hypothetical protein
MAGGGGRDNIFTKNRTPEKITELVREAELSTSVAQFETELSSLLGELLAGYNNRDSELVQRRIETLRASLENEVDGEFDQLFGGSVAKRTYVDGLSDIDSLWVLNRTELAKVPPSEALARMQEIIQARLGEQKVTHGRMAITVDYNDGMNIQLLPVIKTPDGLKVPSSRRDAWSHIEPQGFRAALTKRNDECNKKLVPTIKLAKAILGTLPENQRLSGYHVESLAISAFAGYAGAKIPSAMLPHFFERAKTLVLEPIKDRTGQSIHVDEYLGPPNAPERQAMSHILERISKRMRNATRAGSKDQWRSLFGDE